MPQYQLGINIPHWKALQWQVIQTQVASNFHRLAKVVIDINIHRMMSDTTGSRSTEL